MKKFCKSLKQHAMEIINFTKKKMKLLTKEQKESFENAEIYHICKEKFGKIILKDKRYCKARDHCYYIGEHRGAVHRICDLKYSVSKKFL